MIKQTNLLVQYKGGGYDGCHWEWNYFMFDAKGNFHDIASSGLNGITEKSKALELLANGPKSRYPGEQSYYSYSLTDKEAIEEFQSECTPRHIECVTKAVNEIIGDDILYWTCDVCEDKQTGRMFHDGYHGNGGIGVVMTGKICEDCYCNNSCRHCGGYIGVYGDDSADWLNIEEFTEDNELNTKEVKWVKKLDDSDGPICKYCAKSELEKFRK